MATIEEKALVLCSGGVDSTTLLAMAVSRYGAKNVYALSISYGQRHNKEIESAKAVAAHYGVEQRFLDLGAIFADSDCSLLSHSSQDIPEESYADQLAESDGKPVSTYVPFRNGLFLSAAASMALSLGCGAIYYGAHHDDWAGNAYPDCSREFVDAMNRAIVEGTGGELHLCAPFVEMSKADIVARGIELGVPYELTWSCYEGGDYPCGACGTCIDRNRAFEANGMRDPLLDRLDAERAAANAEGEANMTGAMDATNATNEKPQREGTDDLSLLGNQGVRYPQTYDPSVLETFENKHPGNDYFVKFNCPEFTSLCPITGQPDFATIYIAYVPSERMVESKSLKLYLFSFRNHGDFHEDCVNIIMKDLIKLMNPKYIEVWGKFLPRGGISIDPYCNYGKPGTRWEDVAWERLSHHDLYPEKVDNR